MDKKNQMVLLDVHGFLPKEIRSYHGQTRFQGFARLKGQDQVCDLLRFLATFKNRQPFRLVWTEHHAFNVAKVLFKEGWSEQNVKRYIAACKQLAIATGGGTSNVDFKAQAKNDQEMYLELCRIAVRLDQEDTEDAAIIKMAMHFRCARLISNDNRVERVRKLVQSESSIIVQTFSDVWSELANGLRKAA